VIDLIKMKSITYKDETMGADYIVGEIPADMLDEAKHYREQLIERSAGVDDTISTKNALREADEITEDEIKSALRRRVNASVHTEGAEGGARLRAGHLRLGVQNRACSRCSTRWWTTCRRRWTSRDQGLHPTRDPGRSIERPARDDAPFAALGFKIMTDPFVGQLTFIPSTRACSAGSTIFNSTKQRTRRIGPAEDARQQAWGNQGSLRRRHRGGWASGRSRPATRSAIKEADRARVRWTSPKPVISRSRSRPRPRPTRESWRGAWQKLMAERSDLPVQTDHQTGEVVIAGMGELHLGSSSTG
jgi:elongation factor G